MIKLFELCQARTKIWRELPNGSHNDTVAEPDYFHFVDEFIDRCVVSKTGYKPSERGAPSRFAENEKSEK